MIDEYVTDERFTIARITAGELETEGDEHDQAITIEDHLKGEMGTTVSFAHDDTWQYLCVGSPAEADTEAIYITTDNRVTQVVAIDSPLYETLMAALNATPVENPEPAEAETRRTLMIRIVGLLQQLISLLQGEPIAPVVEPAPGKPIENIIGMTVAEAEVYASETDTLFRVVEIDGEPQPTTKDYRPGRINASVENDVVVNFTIEGEEEPEPADRHDEILGMTQSEAQIYAESNDVLFRLGRIDDEYLPVTMDYRPGRITAELENGVVVDYSVE
jgi:hypothetical protein